MLQSPASTASTSPDPPAGRSSTTETQLTFDFAPPSHPFSATEASLVYALSEEDSRLGRNVKHGLAVIEEAFEKFGVDGTALSFNGGKDCTVLVHLLAASLFRHASHLASSSTASTSTSTPSSSSHPQSSLLSVERPSSSVPSHPAIPHLETVYVRSASPFPQVEEFVELCKVRYPFLAVERVEGEGGMKEALKRWLGGVAERRRPKGKLEVAADQRGRGLERRAEEESAAGLQINGDNSHDAGSGAQGSGVKAVLVGTRRGDPHGAPLRIFDPTDADWPSFVRVHPIIDWEYQDIWDFLRRLGVGWCNLYNYGYTSLGSTTNTSPNPHLKDASRPSGWKPAWELQDARFERAGR